MTISELVQQLRGQLSPETYRRHHDELEALGFDIAVENMAASLTSEEDMKLTNNYPTTAREANRIYSAICDELQAATEIETVNRILEEDYAAEMAMFKQMIWEETPFQYGEEYYKDINAKASRRRFEINLEQEFKICN